MSPTNYPGFPILFEQLRNHDETVELEAKRGSEIGRSILESVCAFSNEPNGRGGYILLGVERDESMLFPDYVVHGIENPDKVQNDFVSQCASVFNSPVRPEVFVESYEGRNVLVAFVPEADPGMKPIYFKATGLPGGAFRRIGSSDQRCTEDDVAVLFQDRGRKTFEESPVHDFEPERDFSQDAIKAYRNRRSRLNPQATELSWDDAELLYSLAATADIEGKTTATVCGLVAFGREQALRRHTPFTRVDYIRVPGRRWIEDPENRFDTIDMRGPLLTLAPRVIATILDDLPKTFSMEEDGIHRKDIPLIPERVIREAVVNALMHRNYRTRQPVQVLRYSNRIEIRNPGCSLKPDDRLGEPGSIARNEKIAEILHECNLAETKGSGIRVMREYMEQANLSMPLFESNRDEDTFTLTLLTHHFMGEEDLRWLAQFKDCDLSDDEARALVFLKEAGALNNAAYRDVCKVDTLNASGHLRKLRNFGLLEQKGKARQTYYVPGKRFLDSLSEAERDALSGNLERLSPNLEPLSPNLDPLSPNLEPLSPNLDPLSPNLDATLDLAVHRKALMSKLPTVLRRDIDSLGKRISPTDLDNLVQRACAAQPMGRVDLAVLFRKSDQHMRDCIRRMLNRQRLELLHPDIPNHPEQKYRAQELQGPEHD